MTSLSESTFDILLHGLIGVDYILHLSAPLSPSVASSSTRFGVQHEIEREERIAGGLMWRVAEALSGEDVRVGLSGNPLGDDSNGRLVERENQERDWLHLKRLASLETPYRVVLQTPDTPTVVLSRCQAVRRHDREEFGEESSTRLAIWPRARLICCTDELPFSALSLARFAQAEGITLHLVLTADVSTDETTRAAVEELRFLATNVVVQSDGATDLARQLCANLRLMENGSAGRDGAE